MPVAVLNPLTRTKNHQNTFQMSVKTKTITLSIFYSLALQFAYGQNVTRIGNNYAYFFCGSNYQDAGWVDLPESKEEIDNISSILESEYGFKVEIFENSKKSEIENKIKEINDRSFYQHDQVFFYFSGHGYYNKEFKNGYFIPSDGKYADRKYGSSWIGYKELEEWITANPCPHVLLAIDACYSGAFGARRFKGRPDGSARITNCSERINNSFQYKSRVFLTSGTFDQRTPAVSIFASRLLELLRLKGIKANGIIDHKELGFFLADNLDFPKPQFGQFLNHEEGGDFFFIHDRATCNDEVPSIQLEKQILNYPKTFREVKDQDGNTYRISPPFDGKEWMLQNLKIKVPLGSYCYYGIGSNCQDFGRLYTWESAKQACEALGKGWRLPSRGEWKSFANFFLQDFRQIANTKIQKEVLGGLLDPQTKHFKKLGKIGYFWTNDNDKQNTAYAFFLTSDGFLESFRYNQNFGLSCRCIKDR